MLLNHALIVDGDEVSCAALERALREYGIREVSIAGALSVARTKLGLETELLITAATVAGEACFPLLDRVQATRSRARVIVLDNGAPGRVVFSLGKRLEVSALLEKPVGRKSLWRCLDSLGDASATRSEPGAGARGPASSNDTSSEALERFLETLRKSYRLTNAEVEVLRCGIARMGRADIAVRRRVSTNTLKTQVRSLLGKFGAPSLESLAARVRNDARQATPSSPAADPLSGAHS